MVEIKDLLQKLVENATKEEEERQIHLSMFVTIDESKEIIALLERLRTD